VAPEVTEHRLVVLEELPALGTFDDAAAAGAMLGSATAAAIWRPQRPLFFLITHSDASVDARILFVVED
jgi:hypothetical protein